MNKRADDSPEGVSRRHFLKGAGAAAAVVTVAVQVVTADGAVLVVAVDGAL